MNSLILSGNSWDALKEQSTMLVRSGFLPKGIDTPEKAIAIAMKGHEMGIPPMQAFSHIAIVQGKPCISSELMLAQIYKNVPGAKIEILENDENKAVISARRPGEKATTFSFSMEDAKRAGLTGKGTWTQYPKVMLLWRAISMMARSKFPDAIMGCSYTPEELGADVELGEDGQIIEVRTEEPKKSLPPPEQERAAEKTTPAPTAPKVYNGEKDTWTAMQVQLKARHVPQHLWAKIDQAMRGKTGYDFKKVTDEFLFQDIESQREEIEEIPFG